MSSARQNITEWEFLFSTAKDFLKGFAGQQWPLEPDGSGSPKVVAVHRLYGAFPVPTDIVTLDTSGMNAPRIREQHAAIFRYDFSKPNTPTIRFHGTIPLVAIEDHRKLIDTAVGIRLDSLSSLKDLSLTYIWDPPYCTHIVPYDPRTRVPEYCDDLAVHLSSNSELNDLFLPTVNYNTKYNLPLDSVMTGEQLLSMDERNKYFVKFSDLKEATLSDLHLEVAGIQLIPQVPDDIKRTFHIAKRLYIYGYLEYGFYTVSSHYAHLALDAALHARWSATLPPSVVLKGQNKKTRKLEQQTMLTPSHTKIRTFCQHTGWKIQGLTLDGNQFPHTVKGVVTELEKAKIITIWQRKMIQDVYVQIRNSLTHLEFAPIHSPSSHDLEIAAETINGLFDSVPLPTATTP